MEAKYLDPALSPEERADDLLSVMSRQEKVAQIQNFELNIDDAHAANFWSEVGIGFLSAEWMQDCESIEEAAERQRVLQQRAMDLSPHKIPAIFYAHGIAGAHIPEATTFPSDINRGANFNTRLETQIGAIIARQSLCLGINYVVAPVMDITHDYYIERLKKTYGEARALAVILGKSYIRGIRSAEVLGKKAEVVTDPYGYDFEQMDDAQMDEIVRYVLIEKFRLGLFESPFALQGEELQKNFHLKGDTEVTRICAEESLILLKNEGALPIHKKVRKIALIGPHATDITTYFMNEKSVRAYALSIYDRLVEERPNTQITCLPGYSYDGDDSSGYEEALAAVKEADIAILTLGSRYEYWNHEMGAMDIQENCGVLPPSQENFMKLVHEESATPIVGIHFGVHPIASELTPIVCNVVLEALLPQEETASAVVDMITGKVNPAGRLPIEIYDQEQDILHLPFGFGKSFSNFVLSNIRLDQEVVQANGESHITVTLRNASGIAGSELIQVYLRENNFQRGRRKLVGLRKVFFLSGESHDLEFTVSPAQVAVPGTEGNWVVKPGKYVFEVGYNVRDIVSEVEIEFTDEEIIEGPERVFYSHTRVI